MSTDPFDEILNRAKKQLSPEQQHELIRELSRISRTANRANDGRTLYDALAARGLIGSITDAPADLGTNPKHMEGFGKDDR